MVDSGCLPRACVRCALLLLLCGVSALSAPVLPQVWFGKAVRRIVEGETKFSKVVSISGGTSRAEAAALDLQQLFLAMTEEVRCSGCC